MTKAIQIFTLLFLSTSSVIAATGTIVEIVDENELTTVTTDGKQAKMSSSGQDYTIINFKTNVFKHVSPKDKEVMLMDANAMPGGNKAPAITAKMKKLGNGPSIAGYDTEKYSYSVKGKTCGVVYGSQDAAGAEGIKELLNAMTEIAEKTRSMMGGYAGMLDDCDQAEMNMINQVGVPMRVEKNGKVLTEVKSIKVSVDLPKDTFIIPASYKTMSMEDKMAEAQKQIQKHQPQIQDMMQQMQQSGQMTPEMMEQMRRAQEMMQQYQQR